MTITKYQSPCDNTPALDLIEEIFGKFERDLETPQLDGTETKYNKDVIFIATEGDTVLGMIHVTVPIHAPYLAGVSGVCTTEAARGKGIGKALFKAAVDELDELGVKYSVLGTGNPIAAKMYSSFGFSYMQNSSVMIRLKEGGVVDFYRELYGSAVGKITVADETAAMRIPTVPLMLYLHDSPILDINIGVLSTLHVPEVCCMSLYPRYMALKAEGGRVLTATDERGVLGAFASIQKDGCGVNRIDFFSHPSFDSALPEMISTLIPEDDYYFEVSVSDGRKTELLEKLGYSSFAEGVYKHGAVILPTVKYKKV